MFSTSSDITFNSLLLIFHYFLQGLIMGLMFSTFPLKLKEYFNYSDLGLFYYCSYPFSFKLIWSPLVDTYYFKSIGLRKTWIILSQIVCGGLLFVLYFNYEYFMSEKKIYYLAVLSFLIIFCVATQDIAVDALALTISGKEVSELYMLNICDVITYFVY